MTDTARASAIDAKMGTMAGESESSAAPVAATTPLWRRLLPIAVLAVVFAAFFALGLDKYLTFEALRDHRMALSEFVARNIFVAGLVYVAIYATGVSISVPGASVLTIAGGLMFGVWLGTLLTVIAATIGAVIIFLIARSAFGDTLRKKAGGRVEKLLSGFQENAVSYMLILRLIPLFPFFVVNVAPALAGVSLRVFALTTLVGIVPGTWVYSQFGAGIGSIFDSGEAFTPSGILTTDVVLALVGLAVLSFVPVVYKQIKARRV